MELQPAEATVLPDDHGTLTQLDLGSGRSYGAGVDVLVGPDITLGFNWSQQASRLTKADQTLGTTDRKLVRRAPRS